jgi:hypothetical protein
MKKFIIFWNINNSIQISNLNEEMVEMFILSV